MRYRELNEARPWKTYNGRSHPCIIASPDDWGDGRSLLTQAIAHFGFTTTGKTEVFHGYFVRIVGPEKEWLGEDRYSLRKALREAEVAAQVDRWSIIALGCTSDFRETGLSAGSGYGTHPAYPDRHVHMFEPIPRL